MPPPPIDAVLPSAHTHRHGFSLIEALIALGVAGIALVGILMINSQSINLVRSSRMTNAATLSLQERVEQMRIANWRDITDATYVRDTFFAARPQSSAPLANLTESLKLSAYPDPTTTAALEVERSSQGTTIVSTGAEIPEETLVRVDFRMEWTGEGGRARSRESSTILSKVGVTSVNLAYAGGAFDPNDFADENTDPDSSANPDPDGSATPDPDASSTPSPTPTPTATPTPSSGNGNGNGNGNANGLGNVNGQGGQG